MPALLEKTYFTIWSNFMKMVNDDMNGPIGTWLDIVKGNASYRAVVNSAAIISHLFKLHFMMQLLASNETLKA